MKMSKGIYSVLNLAEKDGVLYVIRALYRNRAKNGAFLVYLPLVNSKVQSKIADESLTDEERMDWDDCFGSDDLEALKELKVIGVISLEKIKSGDEDGTSFEAVVKIIDQKAIEQINELVEKKRYLSNRGQKNDSSKQRQQIGPNGKLVIYLRPQGNESESAIYYATSGKVYKAQFKTLSNPFKLLKYFAENPYQYHESEELSKEVLNHPRFGANDPTGDRRIRDTIKEIRSLFNLNRDDDFFLIEKCHFGIKCDVDLIKRLT